MLSPAVLEVIDAITQPTSRGKQKRIGPSQLGNPCDRCLTEQILLSAGHVIEGAEARKETTTVPTFIGTAVHERIEALTQDIPGAYRETKVEVGEVRGYGTIKGTADYYNENHRHLIDYKVVKKDKIAQYSRLTRETGGEIDFASTARGASNFKTYFVQLNLYASGLIKAGHPVERMSLLMLPRDEPLQRVEKALTEFVFEPVLEVAELALERASQLYEWGLDNLTSLSELDSDKDCYYCKFERFTRL